ncbi:IS1 family transposase [Escherichia coli]|nr:IS1 family transposase [Escherichia coli]
MDEQWGYVGAKSRQRWLFYAYDSARKWTNSGAMSGLNRASAGCFTRMTGSGRRLLRTYSVNARWRRWGVL